MKTLIQLSDKSKNVEKLYVGDFNIVCEEKELFRLFVSDANGLTMNIISKDFLEVTEKTIDDTKYIEYKNCSLAEGLEVIASLAATESEAKWGFEVKNNTDKTVEKIYYPCINAKNALVDEGGEYKVFLPCFEGAEITKISDIPGDEKEYPGFLNMQYMAYYNGKQGLYICAEDTLGIPKIIDCVKEDNGLAIVMGVYVNIEPGCEYKLPYPVVMKRFSGDWQDASEIYRDFVENSDFPLPEKMEQRDDIPQFVKDYAVVTVYPVRSVVGVKGYFGKNEYMPYCNGLKYFDDLKLELGADMMAFLVGWEGSATWAPPLMWPPYGGEEELSRFVDEMHKRGNYVGLYGSGLNWTDKSIFVKECDFTQYRIDNNLDSIMTKKRDQTLDPDVGFPMIRTGYHMCCHCDGTRKIVYDQFEGIISSGIDYMQYFDQNLCGKPAVCYAKDHGHPSSYGVWASDDMREIADEMYKIVEKNGKNCVIGCECAPADYLLNQYKFNDHRFHWVTELAYWCGFEQAISVPAFQYVYSEYIKNFMGNQCDFTKHVPFENKDSFLFRTAYSFVAGDLLTIILKGGGELHFDWGADWIQSGPPQVVLKRFINTLCNFHRGEAYNYLMYGRMVKDIPFEGAKPYVMTLKDGRKIAYPDVISKTWEYKGKKVQIFVNYLGEERTIVSEKNFTRILDLDDENMVCFNKITIPPYSAVAAEIE